MSAAKKSPAHNMAQARIESWAVMLDTRPDTMSEYERRQIVNFLRRMSRNPAAIEAMITTPKGRGKPSTLESRERASRIALDYIATKERFKLDKSGKAADATIEVSKAWGVGRTAVLEAHKDPRWRPWIDYERKRFAIEHPALTGAELLRALSMELRKSG